MHRGSHFTLEMPFGPPFKSVWVEDLTVKVTGAASSCVFMYISVCLPSDMKNQGIGFGLNFLFVKVVLYIHFSMQAVEFVVSRFFYEALSYRRTVYLLVFSCREALFAVYVITGQISGN